MSLDRIASNSAFLLVARIAEKGGQFVVLWMVARYTALDVYGAYSLAVYFTALCTILFDWGIQPYAIREVASSPARAISIYRHGLSLKLLYLPAGLAIVALVLWAMHYPRVIWIAILLLLLGRVVLSFAQFNAAVFRAHGLSLYEAVTSIAGVACLLAVTFVMIGIHAGVAGFALAWLCFGITEAVVSFVLLFGKIVRGPEPAPLDPAFLRQMATQSFIFGLCSVATLVYFYMDTVFLSKMASLQTVSHYTAAYNLVFALILVPQVLVDALFPLFSRRHLAEGRSIHPAVKRIACYFLWLTLPMGVGGMLLAGPIIRFVYGGRYVVAGSGADRAFAILVWDACLVFFTYLYGSVLAVFQRQSRVTLIAMGGALLNIVLNLVLIPRYVLTGAAVATVVTEAANLVLLVGSLLHCGVFEGLALPAFQSMAAAACMGLLLWRFAAELPLAANIACGIIVYGSVLLLSGAFRHEHFWILRGRPS